MNCDNKSQEVIQNALDLCNEEKERLELLLLQSKKPIHELLQFDGFTDHDDIGKPSKKVCSHGKSKEFRRTGDVVPVRLYIDPRVDKNLIAELLAYVHETVSEHYLYADEQDGSTNSIDDLPF